MRKAKIFLSYASEDRSIVEKFYNRLSRSGFKPWIDSKDIMPGEKWKISIKNAIKEADFVLFCLSNNSYNKRGYIQREIRDALDLLQEKLDDDIYIIPVRFERCKSPDSLSEFQRVDMFESDGWSRLIRAMQKGMGSLPDDFNNVIIDTIKEPNKRISKLDYESEEGLVQVKIRPNDEIKKYRFSVLIKDENIRGDTLSIWQVSNSRKSKLIVETEFNSDSYTTTLDYLPTPPFEIRNHWRNQ